MTTWVNARGRRGCWGTTIHGCRLRIDYSPSAKEKHYRITSRYSTEMFGHQFYKTLKEAQKAAITMLEKHLKIREAQGMKVRWDRS